MGTRCRVSCKPGGRGLSFTQQVVNVLKKVSFLCEGAITGSVVMQGWAVGAFSTVHSSERSGDPCSATGSVMHCFSQKDT